MQLLLEIQHRRMQATFLKIHDEDEGGNFRAIGTQN